MRRQTFSVVKKCKPKHVPIQTRRKYCVEVTKTGVQSKSEAKSKPICTEVSPSWPKDQDIVLRATALQDMQVFPDFITETEEIDLLKEIEPKLKRMRYEYDHWDNAIEGYRETEHHMWWSHNEVVLSRVRATAAPRGATWLPYTHVLDLSPAGFIKPHIDAVRFCGDIIAGLCLVSSAVMRLTHAGHARYVIDALLPRRSLYVMRGVARYDFTHEVLSGETSKFRDNPVPRQRRIAIICRTEPKKPDDSNTATATFKRDRGDGIRPPNV